MPAEAWATVEDLLSNLTALSLCIHTHIESASVKKDSPKTLDGKAKHMNFAL